MKLALNIFLFLLIPYINDIKAQITVYNDTNTLITGTWNGNGTLTEVTSNVPCAGNKHYQFQYNINNWWAGFGLNLNSWAIVPGIKYDLTNYESIRLTYKGLAENHQLYFKLRNNYINNSFSNEITVG
ncbi:MAG TPA: hypothetical protein PKD85_15395, partial [Saprospiraceae bacterium]|nr:hypothetical protein [Saprospiraceae bacterium]